jgi:hypothetical protein
LLPAFAAIIAFAFALSSKANSGPISDFLLQEQLTPYKNIAYAGKIFSAIVGQCAELARQKLSLSNFAS